MVEKQIKTGMKIQDLGCNGTNGFAELRMRCYQACFHRLLVKASNKALPFILFALFRIGGCRRWAGRDQGRKSA